MRLTDRAMDYAIELHEPMTMAYLLMRKEQHRHGYAEPRPRAAHDGGGARDLRGTTTADLRDDPATEGQRTRGPRGSSKLRRRGRTRI